MVKRQQNIFNFIVENSNDYLLFIVVFKRFDNISFNISDQPKSTKLIIIIVSDDIVN